jgi:hypothetical protein
MRKSGDQYCGGTANEEAWGTGTGEAQLLRETGGPVLGRHI